MRVGGRSSRAGHACFTGHTVGAERSTGAGRLPAGEHSTTAPRNASSTPGRTFAIAAVLVVSPFAARMPAR